MAKKIYLVRHGQTHGNVFHLWQGEDEQLSELGERQAAMVAERLSSLTFDYAVASPLVRTKHTAEIISTKVPTPFEFNPLFKEVVVPTSTIGFAHEKDAANPVHTYITARDAEAENPEYRYEDEETIAEVIERCKQALAFLESVPHDSCLVVTHGTILRTIVASVLFQGTNCSPHTIFTAGRHLRTTNTGITVLCYDEEGWTVKVFNDHAHFAE